MAITFQFLRDLQKRERESSQLQEIPPTFYEDVKKYIHKKMKKSSDVLKGTMELKSVFPVVRFIFERREQKIVNGALRFARAKNGKKPKNMTPSEEKMFDSLVEIIDAYRIDVEKLVYERNDEDEENIEDEEEIKEEKIENNGEKEDVEEKSEIDTKEDDGFIKIEILEDIPEFVAEDLETYGPWSSGERVVAPKQAANVLIDAGKAKVIEES